MMSFNATWIYGCCRVGLFCFVVFALKVGGLMNTVFIGTACQRKLNEEGDACELQIIAILGTTG